MSRLTGHADGKGVKPLFVSPGQIVIPDLLATALPWQPFRDGVAIVPIHGVGTDGCSAALLRYEPGATVPRHLHTGFEHILVLSGSQRDDNGRYDAGTLVVNRPGTSHAVASPEGCIVLAIWERPVAFGSLDP